MTTGGKVAITAVLATGGYVGYRLYIERKQTVTRGGAPNGGIGGPQIPTNATAQQIQQGTGLLNGAIGGFQALGNLFGGIFKGQPGGGYGAPGGPVDNGVTPGYQGEREAYPIVDENGDYDTGGGDSNTDSDGEAWAEDFDIPNDDEYGPLTEDGEYN